MNNIITDLMHIVGKAPVERYSEVKYNPHSNIFSVSKIRGEYIVRGPLNVGFQLTRRCNLRCLYCSETPPVKEMDLAQIEHIFRNLRDAGVKLIKLTGGEPLMRRDIREIVSLAKNFGFYVAMDSNVVLMDDSLAKFLADNLVYLETTIDGGERTHNRVRGKYKDIIANLENFSRYGTPVYVAMVILGDSLEDAKKVLQTADRLGAKTVKYLLPIPKARGKKLPRNYLINPHLNNIWQEIVKFKKEKNLKPIITLSDWSKIGNGSVILIHPDGYAVGSPSAGEKNCVTVMGNLLKNKMSELWRKYPHRNNHILKYNFKTMYKCT